MSRNLNILDESDVGETECNKKVASGRRVAGAIRSLVIARDLQLESMLGLRRMDRVRNLRTRSCAE